MYESLLFSLAKFIASYTHLISIVPYDFFDYKIVKHGVLEQTWLLFVLNTNQAIAFSCGGALSLHLKLLIFLILQAVHQFIELCA